MESAPHIDFSYWSDPLCIWAFVAQPKLDRLLSRHASALVVKYRVVPVFGSVRQRFGPGGAWAEAGVEGRVKATRNIAERFGHHDVNGEVWRTACPESSWAPGAALKAVDILECEGTCPPETLARFQWKMRQRFFVDNCNIGDRQEQLAVAEMCDIPRAPLEQLLDNGRALALLWEDAREKDLRGIQGSPTYVFDGGRVVLYGNVSEAIVDATAQELVAGLQAGCSHC